jgi:hypothetical protein
MNSTRTISNSNPILDSIYQGALYGALGGMSVVLAKGAQIGVSVVFSTAVTGVFYTALEKGNRLMRNEPIWPIFEGDCQLEQFRDLPTCTNPPLVDPFASFTVYAVSIPIIFGIAGAVYGAAKGVFAKSHSE